LYTKDPAPTGNNPSASAERAEAERAARVAASERREAMRWRLATHALDQRDRDRDGELDELREEVRSLSREVSSLPGWSGAPSPAEAERLAALIGAHPDILVPVLAEALAPRLAAAIAAALRPSTGRDRR
jgi:hypothetical protein